MKSLIFVANWKSHKTSSDALSWWQAFSESYQPSSHMIILAVSYTLLPILAPIVSKRQDIFLAAQDVSAFEEGAHTAAIAAVQIKEFAQYVLIGHSEVRKETKETTDMRQKKIQQAAQVGIHPFVFYNGLEDTALQSSLLVYEPPTAISPNPAESPKEVDEVSASLHISFPESKILYGGSVNEENVRSYASLSHIDGVVIGHASLDPHEFMEVIRHAT